MAPSSSACAVRDGDEWVLTGQKVWSTWAHLSDLGICLARTDPTVPKRQGITYFVVDLHRPGVEVRRTGNGHNQLPMPPVHSHERRAPDATAVQRET